MDFNYYYQRRQVESLRAENASSPQARAPHQALAEAYDRLIDYEKRQRGAVRTER